MNKPRRDGGIPAQLFKVLKDDAVKVLKIHMPAKYCSKFSKPGFNSTWKDGTIKNRDSKDLTEAEEIKKRWQVLLCIQKNCTKKVLMTQITMMVCSLT